MTEKRPTLTLKPKAGGRNGGKGAGPRNPKAGPGPAAKRDAAQAPSRPKGEGPRLRHSYEVKAPVQLDYSPDLRTDSLAFALLGAASALARVRAGVALPQALADVFQAYDAPPQARVVLLGASNLTRGISIVVETARLVLGAPLEVFVAMGHGRSYGKPSRILGRTLPGIVECDLWAALKERPALPTFALVTDIGNDVAYGYETGAIASWVEACLDRLGESGARKRQTQTAGTGCFSRMGAQERRTNGEALGTAANPRVGREQGAIGKKPIR